MTDALDIGTEIAVVGDAPGQPATGHQAPTPRRADLPNTPDAGGPFKDVGGSKNPAFNDVLLLETLAAVYSPGDEPGMKAERQDRRASAVAQALTAFKPQDEIEGLLAAQAVALHFGAMECLRRAMLNGQPFDVATKLRKDGANLARGMTDMLAALDRKRGKGPQVIRVERMVVQDGGQAVVGTVQAGALQSPVTPAPPSVEHAAGGIVLDAAADLVAVPDRGRGGV